MDLYDLKVQSTNWKIYLIQFSSMTFLAQKENVGKQHKIIFSRFVIDFIYAKNAI